MLYKKNNRSISLDRAVVMFAGYCYFMMTISP